MEVALEGPQWYALRTHMGFEDTIAKNLMQSVESLDLKDQILDVVVPKEKQVRVKGGQKSERTERIYPGFVLINMVMNEQTRMLVLNSEHINGFVGSRTHAEPLSKEEIEIMFERMNRDTVKHETDIEEGDPVRITEGPFANLEGKVGEVDPERGQVTVFVPMFGRETPVRLDLFQIRRL